MHGTIASRDNALPAAPDETPRYVTTLLFHATLPRLLTLAYAPNSPMYAPHIAAWW
jgi:hypothetical protein